MKLALLVSNLYVRAAVVVCTGSRPCQLEQQAEVTEAAWPAADRRAQSSRIPQASSLVSSSNSVGSFLFHITVSLL